MDRFHLSPIFCMFLSCHKYTHINTSIRTDDIDKRKFSKSMKDFNKSDTIKKK